MSNEVLDLLWEDIKTRATPEEIEWALALRNELKISAQKLNFIAAVKRARKDAGLSQRALAKLVGMQQHDLCQLEKGKTNPTFETQQKLFAQLGIEVSYHLAGGTSASQKTEQNTPKIQKTA